MEFSDPQVILFVADTERAASFYGVLGFRETFRAPQEDPVKIEMALGGFTIGLALPQLLAESHGHAANPASQPQASQPPPSQPLPTSLALVVDGLQDADGVDDRGGAVWVA